MTKQSLAEVIKEARENKGISQRELARRTGADNSSLAKLEKGLIAKPSELLLRKLSNILNIDEEKLLRIAGYNEEDIKFITTLSEKNIMDYFSNAVLYEVDQMIKRLELEIASKSRLRDVMKVYDIRENTALSKEEKKTLLKDWQNQIEEHNFKIESLYNVKKQLEEMFNNRINNGESIVKNDKDITSILEDYIKYIYNKNN